jgi:integrase/recombinase XerD
MMLTLGVDIYTTSKLLGHANVTTTEIYADVVMEKKVDAVNMLNGIF